MLNGGIYASHQQTQQERRREQERMQTIDSVLNASNLSNACYEVIRNDGAAGVDKMNVKELKEYLDINRTSLTELIRHGDYLPQPIRGKELRRSRSHDRRE